MKVNPGELTGVEQAVLLVLMAECRPVRNPELKTLGPELRADSRRKLNDRGLVDSAKESGVIVHELTDDGWATCRAIIGADAPKRTQGQAKALYTFLKALDRYFERSELQPSDVFVAPGTDPVSPAAAGPVTAPAPAVDPEHHVRAAYARLAKQPGAWVALVRLRDELRHFARQELDAVLQQMYRIPGVHLIPEENQKVLTPQDRAAAVEIGDQNKHLIAIDQ